MDLANLHRFIHRWTRFKWRVAGCPRRMSVSFDTIRVLACSMTKGGGQLHFGRLPFIYGARNEGKTETASLPLYLRISTVWMSKIVVVYVTRPHLCHYVQVVELTSCSIGLRVKSICRHAERALICLSGTYIHVVFISRNGHSSTFCDM